MTNSATVVIDIAVAVVRPRGRGCRPMHDEGRRNTALVDETFEQSEGSVRSVGPRQTVAHESLLAPRLQRRIIPHLDSFPVAR